MLLLLGVTWIPFPTAVLAEHLTGHDQRDAGILYAASFLAIALVFNLMWRYVVRMRLAIRHLDVAAISKQYLMGPVFYAALVVIALVNALYLAGGIRSVEIGSVMFAARQDGTERAAGMELVRLAIPRRLYTQSHLDYVANVVTEVGAKRKELHGYRIVSAPRMLRHFTAEFEPLRSGVAADRR